MIQIGNRVNVSKAKLEMLIHSTRNPEWEEAQDSQEKRRKELVQETGVPSQTALSSLARSKRVVMLPQLRLPLQISQRRLKRRRSLSQRLRLKRSSSVLVSMTSSRQRLLPKELRQERLKVSRMPRFRPTVAQRVRRLLPSIRRLLLPVARLEVTSSWASVLLQSLKRRKVKEVAEEAAEEAEAAEVVVVPLRPKPKRLVGAVMPRRL